MKRRLLAVALALILAVSAAVLTGCEPDDGPDVVYTFGDPDALYR